MRDFKRIRTGEYDKDQIQQNLVDYFAQFRDSPLLNGILHKDKTINTTFSLDHKLSREPIGYIITKKNRNETIWNGIINSTSIELLSSGNVVVDIWVF